MDRWAAPRLGWMVLALDVALVLAAATLVFADLPVGGGGVLAGTLLTLGIALVYAAVGALLVSRQPANRIGWLFCGLGLLFAVDLLADEYALRGLVAAPGSLPAVVFTAWLQAVLAGPIFAAGFPLLFLTFPDGRLPAPRWRPVLWLVGLLLLIQEAVIIVARQPLATVFGGIDLGLASPTGWVDVGGFRTGPLRVALVAIDMLFATVIGACGAALVLRLRSSRGIERQQARWLAYAGSLLVAGLVVYLGAQAAGLPIVEQLAFDVVVLGATAAIPVAAAFAILRYHLYGIDVVISRTLLVGAMAVFVTAVYVAIVAGVGSLARVGLGANLALSLAATALVAVAFQPVRERVQRVANQVVYGHRASPYEVLAHFGDTVPGPGDQILTRTARVLAEGVGAARAEVWMCIDAHLVLAAAWPEPAAGQRSRLPLDPASPPGVPGADRSVPVVQEGELLGMLAIALPAGQELAQAESKLLADLAAQAAVALRNVRLTAALRARLDETTRQEAELTRSRQRVVAAQDAERRRLERNIHDGAQQHLVALAVKLRLAGNLAGSRPERARQLLVELRADTARALETLRELGGGDQPAALQELGLGRALRAHASRLPLPVTVEDRMTARCDGSIEAAVYFCCLEALQNTTKHASASRALVLLEPAGQELHFSISDDGAGFDLPAVERGAGLRNMRERLAAVGGELVIETRPGAGATVSGRAPVAAWEPAGRGEVR